jgi:hypothetical protein
MFLDCRHVCKTCVFHDAVQAGKQKEVHPPYSRDLAPMGESTVDGAWLTQIATNHVTKKNTPIHNIL